MPNRRVLEMTVVVVVLMQPVIRAANVWARKHLATSTTPGTRTAAEVVEELT